MEEVLILMEVMLRLSGGGGGPPRPVRAGAEMRGAIANRLIFSRLALGNIESYYI